MNMQMTLLRLVVIKYLMISVLCTADMTLPIYQYLSNHMTEEECRTLAAALHFRSYKLGNSLNEAEAVLPEDVNCLGLLLHWDTTPGEGKVASPEIVIHRLNQIGKKDLADWLQRTLFSEFNEELELVTITELEERVTEQSEERKKLLLAEWMADNDYKDNVIVVAVIFVVATVTAVVVAIIQVIVRVCRKKSVVIVVDGNTEQTAMNTKTKNKVFGHMNKKKRKKNTTLEEGNSDTDQDSETALLLP